LCLKTLKEGRACNQGHVYCKECIVENLFMQRQENEKLRLEYEEQERNNKLKTNVDKEKIKQLNFIKESEDNVLESKGESSLETVYLYL
jgi:hypothetical protein